jgi:hypothetical protein
MKPKPRSAFHIFKVPVAIALYFPFAFSASAKKMRVRPRPDQYPFNPQQGRQPRDLSGYAPGPVL